MTKLTDPQVTAGLSSLPGWRREGESVVKTFEFDGFAAAVSALVRLAFEAEAADHHPDVSLSYRKLTLGYTTHSEGGLTQKDLDGAATAERVLGSLARGGA